MKGMEELCSFFPICKTLDNFKTKFSLKVLIYPSCPFRPHKITNEFFKNKRELKTAGFSFAEYLPYVMLNSKTVGRVFVQFLA